MLEHMEHTFPFLLSKSEYFVDLESFFDPEIARDTIVDMKKNISIKLQGGDSNNKTFMVIFTVKTWTYL